MTFEQPDNLETLQTDLAAEIARSDACVKSAEEWDSEAGIRHAKIGILAEMRIKRLERMIKAEKKRLKRLECPAPKAAGTQTKLDAILAAVAPQWLLRVRRRGCIGHDTHPALHHRP